MRASRILANRPERAIVALADLCEERKDDEPVPAPYVPPRLSTLPPQTPYTIGSSPLRPKGAAPDRLSPPTKFFEPSLSRLPIAKPVSIPPPPEHMAARRSKWTSPPPPEASPTDHTFFEDQLGKGLKLATASTEAREIEPAGGSSPGNSEKYSDDEHRSDTAESDDVLSVRSFTEGSLNNSTAHTDWTLRLRSQECLVHTNSMPSRSSAESPNTRSTARGRVPMWIPERLNAGVPAIRPKIGNDHASLSRAEVAKRSLSGSPRTLNGFDWPPSNNAVALITPLPPSPITPNYGHHLEAVTVYYQTPSTKAPRPTLLHPPPGASPTLLPPPYGRHQHYNGPPVHDSFPSNGPLIYPRAAELSENGPGRSGGLDTPTPTSFSRGSHSHSPSTSTITASRPRSQIGPSSNSGSVSPTTRHKSKSRSPAPARLEPPSNDQESASDRPSLQPMLRDHDSIIASSSGYSASLSLSPSPSPPPTAQPPIQTGSTDNAPSPTPDGDNDVMQVPDMQSPIRTDDVLDTYLELRTNRRNSRDATLPTSMHSIHSASALLGPV